LEIIRELVELTDIAYASARKGFYVRGGFVTIRSDDKLFEEVGSWQVVFEDHSSYGGMSLKEVAILIDGLKTAFGHNPPFYELEQIRHSLEKLDKKEIPVAKPPGGLGIHVDARRFLEQVPLIPEN
jgi:tyrosine phenol-lyase